MESWYVLYTKPHKETLVHRQLEDRDLPTFFPYVQYNRGYGRGIRLEPFFPCYLFLRVDLTSAAASGLTWLAGVRHLVSFEGRPAQVPDCAVETLQARLAPLATKVVAETEVLFSPGETVRVLSGPLAGMEGIFQRGLSGSQRVQILLNLLGQWSRVDLDARQLVAAQRRDPAAVRALVSL